MPTAPNFEWPQGNPLFEVQWRAITESLAGNGVLTNTDFEITTTATTRQVNVSSGTLYYLATEYSFSGGTLTLSSGDSTYDRWDTIYFDTSTTSIGVREGTAQQYPEPPDISGDEFLLGVVYTPQSFDSTFSSDQILNWRAKFSNEAEEVHYDDGTGIYGVSNVDAALDELQEASQISAYPLVTQDIGSGTITSTEISDSTIQTGDIADSAITSAKIKDPTILSSDIENNAVTSLKIAPLSSGLVSVTNPGSFGALFNAPVDNNSPDGTLHAYSFSIDGNKLLQPRGISTGSGGVDTLEVRYYVQANLNGNDLMDNSTTIYSSTDGHIPRPQIDDAIVRASAKTAAYTTADEEFIPVDPSGTGGLTITLASADAESGNQIVVKDVGGTASSNVITVDTEGSETIDGDTSVDIDVDGGSLQVVGDGTNWDVKKSPARTVDPRNIFEGTETGVVANGDQGILTVDELQDGESVSVFKAALTTDTIQAIPSGVDLELVTFDNAGSFTSRATLISGDGSTVYDRVTGNPLASYENTSGGEQSIGVIVDNGSGSSQDVVAKIEGTAPA
jgi:hypothetical protein